MKKFENLGRKLSKEEQKKIMGGLVNPKCETNTSCDCHACVDAAGVTQSWGWDNCNSHVCSGNLKCKSYCCSPFTSGSWC